MQAINHLPARDVSNYLERVLGAFVALDLNMFASDCETFGRRNLATAACCASRPKPVRPGHRLSSRVAVEHKSLARVSKGRNVRAVVCPLTLSS